MSDVRVMTFDLGVNWDELRGETLQEKVQALIQYLGMRGRLQELIDFGREERDNIEWPNIPSSKQQIEDEKVDLTEEERRVILADLLEKIGPLASSVMQIKAMVEANLRYLDPPNTGTLVRFLAGANLSRHITLEAISLRGEDLSRINLGFSHLHGADLSHTNLSGASLSTSDLSLADLRGANLSGAKMRRTYLFQADLTEANLHRADLWEANLQGSNLLNAKLNGANLKGARYDGRTKWPDGFDSTDHDLIFVD